MGDATSAGSPLVQSSAPRRVPRSHGHFRCWAVAPTRVGRAPRPERADRAPSRPGYTRQFPLADLFRQSIYSRLAGYEDTNDAKRLAEDPTFRMLASRERRETSVALTSTLHWFETEVLAEERNYQGLARLNTELVQREATPRVRSTGLKSSLPTTAMYGPPPIRKRTVEQWEDTVVHACIRPLRGPL